jgi:hypothetical protein
MGLFNKDKNHQCSECIEKFSKRKELLVHAVNAHHQIIVKCSLCKKSLIEKEIINHTGHNHHKVSLFWRILFSWSPLAYFHINKFWLAFVISIPFYISSKIYDALPFTENFTDLDMLFIPITLMGFVIPALLMWKWATTWNKKIDEIQKTITKNKSSLKDESEQD